jgi:hypothetical protein
LTVAGTVVESPSTDPRRDLVDVDEYQAVIDRALGGMPASARELGASRVNDFLGPDEEGLRQDGVLLHVLEELAQHHGQLQVLRDVLLAAGR